MTSVVGLLGFWVMTPNDFAPSKRSLPSGKSGRCEACGADSGAAPLLDIPVPLAVLERLGLPSSPQPSSRWLCAECVGKGLQGNQLDLLDLVKLAPLPVQQELHAYLMHVFEI